MTIDAREPRISRRLWHRYDAMAICSVIRAGEFGFNERLS